jgi:hypothetical protein
MHYVQWQFSEPRSAEPKHARPTAPPTKAENMGQTQNRESVTQSSENPYTGRRVASDTTRKAAKFEERDGRELFTTIGGARPDLDATSIDDCRLSCSSDPTCKGFEFKRADLSCRLFSKILKSAPSKTSYSGIR